MTIVMDTEHDDGTRASSTARRELAPTIAGRAAEIEAARRVPRDLLDELIAAGCFRVLLPDHPRRHRRRPAHRDAGLRDPRPSRRVGGLDRDDRSGRVVRPRRAPPRHLRRALRQRPDVIVAGAFNPTGSIAAVDGGYRVTGRWSFASGCEHADWLFGNCVEGIVDGMPRLRVAVFAPDQVVIEDTWNVSGLSGTGSHHFHVDGVVVPAERTFVPLADEPCLDEPDRPHPAAGGVLARHRQRRARHRRKGRWTTSSPSPPPRCRCSPTRRSPPTRCSSSSWPPPTPSSAPPGRCSTRPPRRPGRPQPAGRRSRSKQRARIRAAAVWVTERAAATVDTAYRAGGGSSLYADCPLQRRLRDIHALTQHFLVKRDTLTTAGAILAGQDVDVMVF